RADLLGKVVGEAAGKLEYGLLGNLLRGQRRVAAPADFDAREQIGLGASQLVEARRGEPGFGAENLGVGDKADGCAAAIGGGADLFERGGGEAPGEGLAIEFLVAGGSGDRV